MELHTSIHATVFQSLAFADPLPATSLLAWHLIRTIPTTLQCGIQLSSAPNPLIVYMCIVRLRYNHGQLVMDMFAITGFVYGSAHGVVTPSNMGQGRALLGMGCLGMAATCGESAIGIGLAELYWKFTQQP